MRQIKSNLILTALSFFAGCSFAQSIPWGTWTTVDEHTGAATSIVKVVETENGLMGTIDRILDPAKADVRCTACTDERKDQPIAGMVIFRDPNGHRMITTPVRRILRVAGQEVYYLQTTNSRYRLEVRRSSALPTENTYVK